MLYRIKNTDQRHVFGLYTNVIVDTFPSFRILRTVVLLACLTGIQIIGSGHTLKFDHLTVDDGLSQNSVRCIIQDKQGFMWFGTDNGLNKYDGYVFKVYKHNPDNNNSISHNYVRTSYADDNGLLWFGTWGGGVNRFDPIDETFTRYLHDPLDSNSLSHDFVNTIIKDSRGSYWFGTQAGLDRYNPQTESFLHYYHDSTDSNSLSDNWVTSIIEDQTGYIWVGTMNGLNKLNPQSDQMIQIKHDPRDNKSLDHDQVITLLEDHTGQIWVGTIAGVNNLFSASLSFRHYHYNTDAEDHQTANEVRSIYETVAGDLWIGGHGASEFDPQTETFFNYVHKADDPNSINYSVILSIYEDRSGTLWFGSVFQGINKVDPYEYQFKHYNHEPGDPNSLIGSNVRAILEDRDGVLWLGAEGFSRFDRSKNKFKHFSLNSNQPEDLRPAKPHGIYEDSDGDLWIDTHSLMRYNKKLDRFFYYEHDPNNPNSFVNGSPVAFVEDVGGRLWIGSTNGLLKYQRETDDFLVYQNNPDDTLSLSHNHVQSLFIDPNGILWIGTWGGGLNRFDPDTEQFTRYINDPTDPNTLSNNIIHYIWGSPDGDLWLATRGGGLNRFNPETEEFIHFRESNGFPDDWVYAVLGDEEGKLWFSTNKGLARFDPVSNKLRLFTAEDGLQSNEFNYSVCYKSPSGELFFGGINGFNSFFPNEIQDNPNPPDIAITGLKVFGEEHDFQWVDSSTTIRLNHYENFFSLDFVGLHYADPPKNQYAYFLEGVDKSWIYSGNRRFANYTNIEPGKYVFRVKASNSDGVWNEQGVSCSLIISPPYWKTKTAYVIYFIFFIITILIIDRFQSNRIKRQLAMETDRKIQIERAKINERDKIYAQTAADFHDQVSGEIGILNVFSELMKRKLSKTQTEDINGYLEKISTSSQNIASFKDSFFWILDSGDIAFDDLILHLKDRGYELFGNASIEFQVKLDGTSPRTLKLPMDWKRNLVFIFIEGMNNIVKHANCKHVVLFVSIQDNKLDMVLRDDGRGFNDQMSSGRGLNNMKNRASELNGSLAITTGEQGGVEIHFKANIPHLGD